MSASQDHGFGLWLGRSAGVSEIFGASGAGVSEDFLATLSSLAEVSLRAEEAVRIFQRRLRSGVRSWVALDHERIVGTFSLLIEQKFIHGGGKVAHLEDVAVHHDFQGHGIGGSLIRRAIAEAKQAGCYKIVLQCFEDRIPFYARYGFRRHDVGIRLDF